MSITGVYRTAVKITGMCKPAINVRRNGKLKSAYRKEFFQKNLIMENKPEPLLDDNKDIAAAWMLLPGRIIDYITDNIEIVALKEKKQGYKQPYVFTCGGDNPAAVIRKMIKEAYGDKTPVEIAQERKNALSEV